MSAHFPPNNATAAVEFDAWAPYYDSIHTGLPGDAAFYAAVGVAGNGPVLELGCGTGRITAALCATGRRVFALDCSRPMLDLAATRLAARRDGAVTFVHADMRAFNLRRRFRVAVMPYRTFMHLLTDADQRQALQCVHRHLEPGGRLFLDTWTASLEERAQIGAIQSQGFRPASARPVYVGRTAYHHACAIQVDDARRWLIESHRLTPAEAGSGISPVALSLTRAWTTRAQFARVAIRAGFIPNRVYGDFYGRPHTLSCTNMIWELAAGR